MSLVASLKKFKYRGLAEDKIGAQVPVFEVDKSKATSIDFKEVYKWILSPLIASRLQKPANLHSNFHIQCTFSNQSEEGPIPENMLNRMVQESLNQ